MSNGTIIYCHGFASVGKSAKSDALVKAFGADRVIAPDLPVAPEEVEAILDEIMLSLGDELVVIVGTSLGGFWARYMSTKWGIPCVLVNPSITPSITLGARVNKPLSNYATGKPILITDQDIETFKKKELFIANCPGLEQAHLFLAQDDEMLDYRVAMMNVVAMSYVLKTDGGHRFEQYWPEVVEKIAEILAAE